MCLSPSRTWRDWLGHPTGGGGAESAVRLAKRLRLPGPLRSSLHLRQRRSEKGHHLSAVWGFKEEVRLRGFGFGDETLPLPPAPV